MSANLAKVAWPACTSAYKLDRLALGELSAEESAELNAHIEACALCRRAAESLGEVTPLPPLRVRTNRLRWMAAGAGLAAAASLLFVLNERSESERIKGAGIALTMYVDHAGEVRRAAAGDIVAPGDAVRFAVTTPVSAYLAIISIDPLGHGSIYYPQGNVAAPIAAGADVPLPGATRLDQTRGRERIIGLFCSSAIDLSRLRPHLALGEVPVPSDCQVTRWSFVKR